MVDVVASFGYLLLRTARIPAAPTRVTPRSTVARPKPPVAGRISICPSLFETSCGSQEGSPVPPLPEELPPFVPHSGGGVVGGGSYCELKGVVWACAAETQIKHATNASTKGNTRLK